MEILDTFLLFTMAFEHFPVFFRTDKRSYMLIGWS